MRRAQKYEFAKNLWPGVSCRATMMAGATSDQSSHTVPNDREFLDLSCAVPDQCLKEFCEQSPVVRDVQPAVIAQVQRQVTEITSERSPVVVPVAIPLSIVHVGSMH